MPEPQVIDVGTVACAPSIWTISSTDVAECPVTFTVTFGKPPRVVLAGAAVWQGGFPAGNRIQVKDITTSGFTLVLTRAAQEAGYEIKSVTDVSWIAVGESQPARGTVSASYKILTVIYSPPGTDRGRSSSSVSYGTGSTAGTTTSSTKTFKQNYTVAFEGSGGFLGSDVTGNVAFGYGQTTTNTESVEIKKTTNFSIDAVGPSKDGIDHNHDQIWLWLKPKLEVTLTPSAATWTFAGDEPALLQYVYVGWLNGTQPMPTQIAELLRDCGITSMHFSEILREVALDPTSIHLDPDRFKPLNRILPYIPPYSETDPVPVASITVTSNVTNAIGSTAQRSYNVDASISGSLAFLDLAKASMKRSTKWEWTDTSSSSNSAGTSESATLKIGGPAYGYQGPSAVAVYFDTLYRTFAFVPITGPVGLKGSLSKPNGEPIPWSEVSVTANGVTYWTYTNQYGDFTLFGDMSGQIAIHANGVTETLPAENSIRAVQIRR